MGERLLIATGNKDKVRELRVLLEGLPYEVASLSDLDGSVAAPEESGKTFEENALLKASYYCEHFGIPCVADDSGLEVDALGGAPGVYSARYAGPGCSYADNNEKLLDALAEHFWHERTARFVCCASYVTPDGERHTGTGTVEGHIAVESQGNGGFGYDPVFVPEGFEQTFAEMRPEQKHKLSHRGKAFGKLRRFLEERL